MVILSTLPPPEEGVKHQEPNTRAHLRGELLGPGTLYISESRVSWADADGKGFSLEYPAISLHAVSRDLSSFPHECLYLMLDGDLGTIGDAPQENHTESSGDEEDSTTKISEIRFIPENKDSLDTLYKAMSECQLLHPDDDDSLSGDEDDEEGYYGDESGADHLTADGRATLERLEAMMDAGDEGIVRDEPQIGVQANGDSKPGDDAMETEQFDDAE